MRWFFFKDLTGSWRWEQERNGEILNRAITGFSEKAQCIADARRHGFGIEATSEESPQEISLN